MKEIYISFIADRLSLKDWQVVNCVALLEEGNTIPFISRYRKERTGGLDDAQVAEIKHWADVFTEMEKRKETILGVISSLDKLTPELEEKITMTTSSSELEDLYLPFRPKRRTRATVAKEAGLEPLSDAMWDFSAYNPEREAAKYVGDKVASVEDALSGARDIFAERLSETASVRETLRETFRNRWLLCKATKAALSSPDAQKYKGYFDFKEPLQRMAPHRLLAVLRAADEGFLTLKIDADPERCASKMYYDLCKG
ncbi:MAG: RNA-binding transcriptional accessory protein, partial [Bacteroidales bacterium]|nr:RNA-binding transcriptional accessory protein [Bacteroidales bacterium]